MKEVGPGKVRLAWMKAHVGIPANERADDRAKFSTRAVAPKVLIDGGIKQQLTARKRQNVPRWAGAHGEWRGGDGGRLPDILGKGNLRGWLREMGKEKGE